MKMDMIALINSTLYMLTQQTFKWQIFHRDGRPTLRNSIAQQPSDYWWPQENDNEQESSHLILAQEYDI